LIFLSARTCSRPHLATTEEGEGLIKPFVLHGRAPHMPAILWDRLHNARFVLKMLWLA
jgi:hypothetical protein